MPAVSLFKPQTQIISSLPNSPFSLFNPNSSLSNQTLSFSSKPKPLSLSVSLNSFSNSTQNQHQEQEEEEEHVVGDGLVFEEGIFEDPYLQDDFIPITPIKKKSMESIQSENLVPDKWKETLEEINITKKERRKIAQEMEFGSRIEKKKRTVPLKDMKEYISYRELKLSQLKPVVLDNPSYPSKEEVEVKEDNGVGEGEGKLGCSSSGRAAPKNPRLAVYKGSFGDISEFFNSENYQPGEKKSEGSRKLFTKEEKVLLNKRIPNLAEATSEKWLPLHTLATSGEFYLVDALLKHNVDINATDKDGLTALHKAIICKKQAVANYLLRESANPFVRDNEGATLLHYGVLTASSPTIKILLLYNVDINLADYDGWTPLHLAVQTRRTDLVKLLLLKGADKTLKNTDGLTPLDLCLHSGRDTRTYELIKLLKQIPKSQRPL